MNARANWVPWVVGGGGPDITADEIRERIHVTAPAWHINVLDTYHGDWGAFFDDLDVFYPVREWPRVYRQMIYGRHLNNQERFTLFLFFVGNGVAPGLAAGLVLFPNAQYDGDAFRQMAFLVNAANRGTLFSGRYTTYQMEHQIGPPPLQRNRR